MNNLTKISATGLLIPVSLLAQVHNVSAKSNQPNILVILSDDMGYSDIGCYGGIINTPNLDNLAAEGLRYTQFYNTARSCPSRASLLTGLHPHQTGIGRMLTGIPSEEAYEGDLNNHCVTMAQVLRPAGYETFAVGKWHVAQDYEPGGSKKNWPLQRGFDHYYGTLAGVGDYYNPYMLCRDNSHISPEADPGYKYSDDKYYLTNAIGDNAVEYLKGRDEEKPFFMYLAFTAAHWPIQALEEDIEPYKGMFDKGWDELRKEKLGRMIEMGVINSQCGLPDDRTVKDWDKIENKKFEARCMEVYAAMVSSMDKNIGKVIEQLERSGEMDNTIIMYLQDNGGSAEPYGLSSKQPILVKVPADGDMNPMADDEIQTIHNPYKTRDGRPTMTGYGAMPGGDDVFVAYGRNWAHYSNTPFREYKHWIHEGGISTPLIVHWGNGIKDQGELRSQPCQLMDIMATCVDVSGAQYPKSQNGVEIYPCEGISLVKSFESSRESNPDRPLFWEHEFNSGVRVGDWKAVYKSVKGVDPNKISYTRWELYNIKSDRSEIDNLADRNPEKLKELVELWEQYALRCKVKPYPQKLVDKNIK